MKYRVIFDFPRIGLTCHKLISHLLLIVSFFMIRTIGSSTICVVAELGGIANFAVFSIYEFCCQRRRLAKWVLAVHEMGVRCVPIVAIVGLFNLYLNKCS